MNKLLRESENVALIEDMDINEYEVHIDNEMVYSDNNYENALIMYEAFTKDSKIELIER